MLFQTKCMFSGTFTVRLSGSCTFLKWLWVYIVRIAFNVFFLFLLNAKLFLDAFTTPFFRLKEKLLHCAIFINTFAGWNRLGPDTIDGK